MLIPDLPRYSSDATTQPDIDFIHTSSFADLEDPIARL